MKDGGAKSHDEASALRKKMGDLEDELQRLSDYVEKPPVKPAAPVEAPKETKAKATFFSSLKEMFASKKDVYVSPDDASKIYSEVNRLEKGGKLAGKTNDPKSDKMRSALNILGIEHSGISFGGEGGRSGYNLSMTNEQHEKYQQTMY